MQFSRAQMDTLTEALLRDFEDSCFELLRTTWRHEFTHLDDAAVREVVRERVQSAERHGFTGQRDIHRFLNLSCYLGLDFERRPELSWAVDLLRRPGRDLGQTIERIVRRHERSPR
jgi:hypothetical protein